jgi:hypothetical protein
MIVYESPKTGLHSAPVAETDAARIAELEGQGWAPVTPERLERQRQRIAAIRAEVRDSKSGFFDENTFTARLNAEGLLRQYQRDQGREV